MLNADDIVHPDDQPQPRRIYMRGYNRLNKPYLPKGVRPQTEDQVRRGIPHDNIAAVAKAEERRKARAAKRAKSFKQVPTQPAESSGIELVWDI